MKKIVCPDCRGSNIREYIGDTLLTTVTEVRGIENGELVYGNIQEVDAGNLSAIYCEDCHLNITYFFQKELRKDWEE